MPEIIPEEWRNAVCEILRSEDRNRIDCKLQVELDWLATFPKEFSFHLWHALEDALSVADIQGERKVMNEPGETYAFFFEHCSVRLIGKINRCPDSTIIIYSAHRPRKGDEL